MTDLECSECGNIYFKKLDECPQCEVELKPVTTNINKQSVKGKRNNTIQVVGGNSGDIIINEPQTHHTSVADTWDYETIKPVMFGSVQPKLNWLGAGSALGFLTGLITLINQVMTFFKSLGSSNASQAIQYSASNTFLIYSLITISFILGIVYIAIRRFNNFNFFGKSIQTGDDGKLFFTEIIGTCDICDSKTKLGRLGNESAIVCTKNPNHYTPFDWTYLPDISEEYKRRKDHK